jgi:hypothetical protein
MGKLATLVFGASLIVAGAALAEGPLDARGSMADNLRALAAAKKPVTVVLKGGEKAYAARIGEVGDHYVVLAELSGKEFYDALVAIDEIAAIEVRAREQ